MSDWYENFKQAKARQEEYTQGALTRLTELVTTYMDEEENFLVPTLENLEQHELTIPSYIHGAYLEIATNTSLLRQARKERDRIVGVALLKIRDHYSGRDIKMPTEKMVGAEVSQNPLVIEAEKALADAEDKLIVSQGLLKAIEAKQMLLPGLQGQRNRLM